MFAQGLFDTKNRKAQKLYSDTAFDFREKKKK